MSVCPRVIGSMRTVRARHPRRGVMLGGKRVKIIAHALSHSGRGGGREAAQCGECGARWEPSAGETHLPRRRARPRCTHRAQTVVATLTRLCAFTERRQRHRQEGGGAHTATPCESRGRWGFSGLAGWRTRLGRHPCIWAAPRHPCATQTWRWEATRPGCGGGRRSGPGDAGGPAPIRTRGGGGA